MVSAKPETIDEYIAAFPEATQLALQQIRETIQKAAPDAVEAISYAMPTFKQNGNLIHFAGYANHIGLYPAPIGIKEFAKELAVYKGGKGSVQFPLNEPMPLELISRIVAFRVKGNQEKARLKKAEKKS